MLDIGPERKIRVNNNEKENISGEYLLHSVHYILKQNKVIVTAIASINHLHKLNLGIKRNQALPPSLIRVFHSVIILLL